MNNYEFKKLTPFKWFVLQNFPFIDEDFDAITNYQLFCKLGEEINKVIESQNLVGEQVETLTNAFNALQAYVENYFANLDVQEEINNKLDEMAESGELTEIISEFLRLNSLLCYDTIADLKDSENVVAGSTVRVLGYYEKNDGGENIYKIIENSNSITPDDATYILLDNGLVAELIYNDFVTTKTFGTKNNGTDDDSIYLKKCHEFANANGLSVLYNSPEYHIKKFYNFDIKTNVDFGNSNIYLYENENIIDNNYFATIPKENDAIIVNDVSACAQLLSDLPTGKISYPLTQKCLIRIFDNTKFFFRRTGASANNGIAYQDMIVVDKDGSIIRGLDYKFTNVSSFTIYKIEDTELTLKNANFINLGNSENYGNEYVHAGIYVLRSNVVFDNINYKVDENGNNRQSDGLFRLTLAYNFTYKNSNIDSRLNNHSSYSMTLSFSILLHLENIRNNDILNSNKWGVMGNNFIKDVYVNNCTLNRFDSHQGAFNVFIDNSVFGYGLIRLVGKGILQITNTIVHGNNFLYLRDDFGATFEGDIIIKNCKLDNTINTSNYARIISSTFNSTHDYGYELFVGKDNIIIEDFEFINENSTNPAYVFYFPVNQSGESYNGKMYLANNIKLKNITTKGFNGLYVLNSSLIHLLKSKVNGKVLFDNNVMTDMNYNTLIEIENITLRDQYISSNSNNLIYNDNAKDSADQYTVASDDIIPLIKLINCKNIRLSNNNYLPIKYMIENSEINNMRVTYQQVIAKNSRLIPKLVTTANILGISVSSLLDNITFEKPLYDDEHELIQADLNTIYGSIANFFNPSSANNYAVTNISNCNFELDVYNLIKDDLKTIFSNQYCISARNRINIS